MKKSLKRTDRGISHYLNLKKDLENQDDRIVISLPLFFRIMFFDSNPWIKQINRFDFLKLAILNDDFENLDRKITQDIYCSKNLIPENKNRKEMPIDEFFNSIILKIKSYDCSVKDFVFALAYNGGIHMIPDKKFEKEYETVYHNFFEKFPIIAFDLSQQISQILVQIFDEFYSILTGSNDAHSLNDKFAPKIAENGKVLEGILFDHSYLQFPIRAKSKKGIRFCTDIKIRNQTSKNIIFEYGHRDNDSLRIQLLVSNSHIITKINTSNENKILKYDLKEKINDFVKIEIALYPNGNLILAINNFVVETDKLNTSISIIDGKTIIGSNLSGSIFGDFFERTIIVQSIDRHNEFRRLNAYSLKRLKLEPQNIPYNQLKREFIE
ncbi:hypothetical protein GUB10_15815 [Salegentibacter sp. BLCTC]|uniref:hypothetical protein n=1 Tax=Salegentibacter sp. BLCTC TaxID=2697368 RepID=UPI00187B5072|nr:hypothetical protein [Salegentibacter sp. BLCTC]MBE7641797.1 hypothetical protein [Salegentibacter sp. BLCTC]